VNENFAREYQRRFLQKFPGSLEGSAQSNRLF
jgi:hypothetical protein